MIFNRGQNVAGDADESISLEICFYLLRSFTATQIIQGQNRLQHRVSSGHLRKLGIQSATKINL